MKIKYDVPIKKLSTLPLDGIFSEVIYLKYLVLPFEITNTPCKFEKDE